MCSYVRHIAPPADMTNIRVAARRQADAAQPHGGAEGLGGAPNLRGAVPRRLGPSHRLQMHQARGRSACINDREVHPQRRLPEARWPHGRLLLVQHARQHTAPCAGVCFPCSPSTPSASAHSVCPPCGPLSERARTPRVQRGPTAAAHTIRESTCWSVNISWARKLTVAWTRRRLRTSPSGLRPLRRPSRSATTPRRIATSPPPTSWKAQCSACACLPRMSSPARSTCRLVPRSRCPAPSHALVRCAWRCKACKSRRSRSSCGRRRTLAAARLPRQRQTLCACPPGA